ncbi:MAG: MlaD family protein [Leptospirales bacterium]|nr:MlaD family protein [Leptospirales bacterium]
MKWLQNLLVGLLFFGALMMVGFFTIVSQSGPFAARGRQYVLFFDNAEGVKTGSRVTVLGVPSGLVDSVDLVAVDQANHPVASDSAERVGQRVAITIELQKEVVFYQNFRVAIKNESLIAGKVISIDPGSARANERGESAELVEVFSASPGELSENDQTALERYLAAGEGGRVRLEGVASGDPVAGIAELISENRQNVRETIENIRDITQKINTGQGTLGLLVNDDELHRNANTLVTDAQTVVKDLRESLEDTREQAPVTSFVRAALTAW